MKLGKKPPKGKVSKTKSRKDLRKEKRQLKKVHRKEYFENKSSRKSISAPGKGNKNKKSANQPKKKGSKVSQQSDEEEDQDFDKEDEEIPSSQFGSDSEDDQPVKKKPGLVDDPMQRFRNDKAKEVKEQKAVSSQVRKRRIEQLKAENDEEDKLIKKLEKRLKIDHSRAEKSVPKCFDDGFDYILEMCLPENINKMYQAAQEANEADGSDEDFADDLNIVTGKNKKNSQLEAKKPSKDKKASSKLQKAERKYFDMDSEDEDSEFGGEDESDDDVQELPTKTVRNKQFPKKEEQRKVVEAESDSGDSEDEEDFSGDSEGEDDFGVDDDDEDFSGDEEDGSDVDEESDGDNSSEEDKIVEDIYGKKRDKDGNLVEETSGTKYVPPHLRGKSGEGADDAKRNEKLLRLRRLLKGSINRLAEQNLHKIVKEIEELYMQNSRNDMNETITKLLTDALISRSLTPERMVLEHCLLIAALHGNVGTEVGAHFLTELVKRFDGLVSRLSKHDVENKELDNVVQTLSHLYTYKVFDCSLVFEMMQRLTSELCEKGIECVLLILKAVGFVLRKEDPVALKEFILEVQKKVQSASEELKENTRLKFMLDILMAVKNNNVNKIPNYDDTVSQHLRKVLKTVLGGGKYVSSLKIPMEDLLQSDQRGKWWVVGSAWTGKTNVPPAGNAMESKIKKMVNSDNISAKLLALAKKHRMSTEDRKNVFCVIMSAEDFLDAFEKLLHLDIKDHKVIVSVLIHCCLSEKTYNPYYPTLAQKFCDFDRKYQLGFQYSAWDRIKEIDTLKQFQVTNFSKFLAHLIMEGGQPLSILKIVEFGSLNKATMKFVRQILLTILLKDEATCKNVFSRIAVSNKLNNFKDSIKLFLTHFLLKGAGKSGVSDEDIDLLKRRITIAEQSMDSLDSRVRF